jgi:hypothetical protein
VIDLILLQRSNPPCAVTALSSSSFICALRSECGLFHAAAV